MAEDGSGAIIVTGAGGFIGRALVERLAARGATVRALLRRPAALPPPVETRVLGDLDAATDWPALLAGARAVVHLASRAHARTVDEQRWIEGEAATAAALARAAAASGIRRLVLMSSIKVLGNATTDLPLRAHQPPAPADVYGLAKWRMEETMRAACGDRLAVIRPPLVYGPDVKANFRALIRLVDSGLPLPFASIDNRRSFVFLDNLLDLVITVLEHPAAAGGVFLLRDDEEVSTPELARRIARALGRSAQLFPCPPVLLRLAASLLGRSAAADRLLSSLRVDDLATRERLGWRPRVSLDDGLAATCRWYRQERE
ncbi:MAG TPA: NAD-dependent epimerase/dehydratase family protein [Stellaceae bacterium]|nr:NAD-dependent epimerase/dehydratase family protein [Stellaceae bacterium]